MPTYLFANNAFSTLLAGITNVQTTLAVQAGHGARFPAPAAQQAFRATLTDASGNIEVIECTARTGDNFTTIVRGVDGTVARSWLAGDSIELRLTRDILQAIAQKDTVVQTGLNADQVDGFDASQAATANNVAVRDGTGALAGNILGSAAEWNGAAQFVLTSDPTTQGVDGDIAFVYTP